MDTNGWNPKPRTNILAPNYIIEEIRDALLNRRLKPGDRLPSELELAELYGVSRGSVRQAMKSLEILGVLTIRPGDGTYVNTTISEKSFNPLVFTLLISGFSDKEIADARYALERDIFELYIDDEKRIETVLPLLEANIAEREELLRTGASPDDLVKTTLHSTGFSPETAEILSSRLSTTISWTFLSIICAIPPPFRWKTTPRPTPTRWWWRPCAPTATLWQSRPPRTRCKSGTT